VQPTALDRYLARVRACHTADADAFVPWFVGEEPLGRVHRANVAALGTAGPFVLVRGRLELPGDGYAARSAALGALVERLTASGVLPRPIGEPYPVAASVGATPRLQLDRAAVPWFGVRALGVHLNGFVRTAAGLAVWIGRRARGKRTFPGHLDNLVAGGCALGATPASTLAKEAHEEASLPAELVARAVRTNQLAYVQQDGHTLKVDTIVCHDLELPAGFVPRPLDGEMESFVLWPAERVRSSLRGDDPWKPNCALVAIDFLLRHGALDAELDVARREHLARAVRGADA
jgi:8-oxo-dGTP pyrophosphatase MutT (NUDIX family)